jgi:DNA polymerase-3 subunit delta
MKYAEFLNQIEKGKFPAVYHFTGEEDFLKREALEKLMAILVEPSLKSFNLDFLQARGVKAEEIINLCATLPFGSGKRMVVVYESQKLHPFQKDELLKYLPHVPKTTCLVLFSNTVDKRLKFYQGLKKLAAEVEFSALGPEETSNWIKGRVKIYEKKMSPDAIDFLQEAVGNNLYELANELEKLTLYVKDRGSINLEDVETVVGYTKAENISQLARAIMEKNLNHALKILKDLSLSRERETSINYRLGDHFLKMYQVKASKDQNIYNLAHALRTYSGFILEYQNQAKNFSLEQLEKGLALLYQADSDLKSGKMPEKFLLELLVYELCRL